MEPHLHGEPSSGRGESGRATSCPIPAPPAGLAGAIEAAAARATGRARTQWLGVLSAVPDFDPLAAFDALGDDERFFWRCSERAEAIVAGGVAHAIETSGVDRFRLADRQRVRLLADYTSASPASNATGDDDRLPLFVGGFGFEDEAGPDPDWKSFPPGRLVLPEWMWVAREDGAWLRVVLRIEPGASAAREYARFVETWEGRWRRLLDAADRPAAPTIAPLAGWLEADALPSGGEFRVRADRAHGVYCAQVEQALKDIQANRLDKVVLARSLEIVHDGRFGLVAFLARLQEIYPACVTLAVVRGAEAFVAATPERLIAVEGREAATAALAGSAPRGRTPAEDRLRGEALLASDKERAEHGWVVDAIVRALAPVSESVEALPAPVLRKIEGIQHLETPIRAHLRDRDPSGRDDSPTGVLALVERLHPTPAVGGAPGPAARAWLRRYERMDRGWYAGPVGWVSPSGGGEFRVALRSGLVRNETAGVGGSRARLYAGAGLVRGSRPEAELEETRIKLRALLAPLTEI